MKILHIANEFGLDAVGGATEAASRRFMEDVTKGDEAMFLCAECKMKQVPPNVIIAGGPFCRFLKRHVLRRVMRAVGCPLDISLGIIPMGIGSVLKLFAPDRVCVHWIGKECLRYEELARISCPVTFFLHDFHLLESPAYRNETAWDRWVLRRIRNVLSNLNVDFEAPSQWVAAYLENILPNAAVRIRPSKIDPIFRLPTKNESRCCKSANRKFRILFSCTGGRRNPYKGYADLEKAIDLLPEALRKNSEVVVVGEDKLLTHVELRDMFYSADCLAFPSLRETQGLVKYEALACGLPVVAYNRTACAEGIAHKVDGYIAADGDVQDFARGLIWCSEARSAA